MQVRGVMLVEDIDSAQPQGGGRALAHVANRPIAHHVLDMLEGAGVEEVVVASSANRAREIRECLAAREPPELAVVRYVEQRAPVDLAGALRLAAPLIGGAPCIVHVASGLLGDPLAPLLEAVRGDSPDVVMVVHQGPAPEGHLSAATQEMLHVAELDPQRAALGIAGVCSFGPGALSSVATADWQTGSDVDLTLVAERVTAAGGSFIVRFADAWRSYKGNPIDLLELNRIALDQLEAAPCRPTNNGNCNRIEGRVRIHDQATVRASVIVGPAVIGPGAHVADSYIGPYTSIGAGARVEGTEIERSIISAGASVMHVGGRLVASVVGRDARIFRDFSLPRALRVRVGDGTEVALC